MNPWSPMCAAVRYPDLARNSEFFRCVHIRNSGQNPAYFCGAGNPTAAVGCASIEVMVA
jgi:hypothetical protein